MTPVDIPTEVEHYFPAARAESSKIQRMEETIAKLDQSRKDLLANYHRDVATIQTRMALYQRLIKVEEIHLRRKIGEDLKVDHGLTKKTRRRRVIPPPHQGD